MTWVTKAPESSTPAASTLAAAPPVSPQAERLSGS